MGNPIGSRWSKFVVTGVVVAVCAMPAWPFFRPLIENLFSRPPAKEPEKSATKKSHDLVRGSDHKPSTPYCLWLSQEAAASLGITSATTYKVAAATEPRALPPLDGILAYENALLYSVRPRFTGEVVEIGVLALETESNSDGATKDRLLVRVGDRVKQGQLLAVIWSKDLGDKKAAFIDALIDLRVDRERLMKLEKAWSQGAIPDSTYNDQIRTVQKGINAVNAAERMLRIWKLEDKEINALKADADSIMATNRNAAKEKDWARAEVCAPRSGTIVEMNTNVGDWVDPSRDPPIFRIADLEKLQIWVHPPEEYLPILHKLMDPGNTTTLTWKIKLQSDPRAPCLEGSVARVSPSVDPNQHTLLVVGELNNVDRKMLVGQFVTATIFVHPDDGLVRVPMSALNEADGQSMVFVQNPGKSNEYALRYVNVANRFKDVAYVHNDSLRPDEIVVTRGVSLMTKALRDLLAKETDKR